MKTPKTPLSKGFLVDLAELTETNCHGEALEEIAEYFDYTQLKRAFEHINALHLIMGYLDHPIADLRRRFTEQLFAKIKTDHGEETALLIKKQL